MSLARRAARHARRVAARHVADADVEVLPGVRARPQDADRLRELMFDFRDQGETAARAALERGEDALHIGAMLLQATGHVAERSAGRRAWDCARGCSHCCHHPVGVTAPEAIIMAASARQSLPPAELDQLMGRLRERAAAARAATSGQDYIRRRIPCAFLNPDGACAAYEVRPGVCRGYNSLDVAACAAGGDGTTPQDNVALVGGGAVISGFRDAFLAADLDDGVYEQHAAVLLALEQPDAAARWRAGERLFTGCQAAALHRWGRG